MITSRALYGRAAKHHSVREALLVLFPFIYCFCLCNPSSSLPPSPQIFLWKILSWLSQICSKPSSNLLLTTGADVSHTYSHYSSKYTLTCLFGFFSPVFLRYRSENVIPPCSALQMTGSTSRRTIAGFTAWSAHHCLYCFFLIFILEKPNQNVWCIDGSQ